MRCPDGGYCPANNRCCPFTPRGRYGCCDFGIRSTCCPDRRTCCPPSHVCRVSVRHCIPLRSSSVSRVQAIPLVNSTEKRCRDGTAGMDSKISRIIPSQQAEQASKRSGLIGTTGNAFFPDEKYQCLHGTSICELSSGIYGCCHLVRGYVNFKQENLCFFGF